MTDWDGTGYAGVSALQRAMIDESVAGIALAEDARILDVGCGDGYLTRTLANRVPAGCAVGVDASRRMITTARTAAAAGACGPWFVVADARRLPFAEHFDAVVSFNALHWVPEQLQALTEIARVLRPGAQALIQMVCAGERASVESVAMAVCHSPRWAAFFADFNAPFVHVDPANYAKLANAAGVLVTELKVTDREWDFGSREAFARWCAVGVTAWTDRLPAGERARFVEDLVDAYQGVAGRAGLFRFTQMRVELHR